MVTSLPDVSELPALGFAGWRRWFEEAAELTMRSVPDEGVAIFFQSDIRHAGRWVDKGHLCARAAERAGMNLLFHHIVCRKPPGTATFGRASYAHLLAFSRQVLPPPAAPASTCCPTAGRVPGRKAMGRRGLLPGLPVHPRRDPHPAAWSTPSAAGAPCWRWPTPWACEAVGVDTSARMCRRARALTVGLRPAEPGSPRWKLGARP